MEAWLVLFDVYVFNGAEKFITKWKWFHDDAVEIALENGIELAVARMAEQFAKIVHYDDQQDVEEDGDNDDEEAEASI
jgi:hypothetical protein